MILPDNYMFCEYLLEYIGGGQHKGREMQMRRIVWRTDFLPRTKAISRGSFPGFDPANHVHVILR